VKRLCATTLLMEAVVLVLAIPVAVQIGHSPARPAVLTGGVAVVLAVVLAAIARFRLSWTLVGGSLLQLLAIASGVVVPAMYFLGVIFTALWIIGIWLGYRVEHAS